jgi:hypothetical protein
MGKLSMLGNIFNKRTIDVGPSDENDDGVSRLAIYIRVSSHMKFVRQKCAFQMIQVRLPFPNHITGNM